MDLGVRVQGSVAGHENGSPDQPELGSGYGSMQERSGLEGEDCWRSSNLERTTTLSFHQGIPLQRSTSVLSSDPRREGFSSVSDKSDVGFDNNKSSSVSPYIQYCRNSEYGLGGMMNTTNMHGNVLTGVKGPFSLTQWAELEQHALIYKYITTNVPVKKSFSLMDPCLLILWDGAFSIWASPEATWIPSLGDPFSSSPPCSFYDFFLLPNRLSSITSVLKSARVAKI